jgi:hypothetical protein
MYSYSPTELKFPDWRETFAIIHGERLWCPSYYLGVQRTVLFRVKMAGWNITVEFLVQLRHVQKMQYSITGSKASHL